MVRACIGECGFNSMPVSFPVLNPRMTQTYLPDTISNEWDTHHPFPPMDIVRPFKFKMWRSKEEWQDSLQEKRAWTSVLRFSFHLQPSDGVTFPLRSRWWPYLSDATIPVHLPLWCKGIWREKSPNVYLYAFFSPLSFPHSHLLRVTHSCPQYWWPDVQPVPT